MPTFFICSLVCALLDSISYIHIYFIHLIITQLSLVLLIGVFLHGVKSYPSVTLLITLCKCMNNYTITTCLVVAISFSKLVLYHSKRHNLIFAISMLIHFSSVNAASNGCITLRVLNNWLSKIPCLLEVIANSYIPKPYQKDT